MLENKFYIMKRVKYFSTYIKVKISKLCYLVNEDVMKQFYLRLIHTLSIVSHAHLIPFHHYNIAIKSILDKSKIIYNFLVLINIKKFIIQ